MTSLIGGKRVPKNSVRLESYGTVDELKMSLLKYNPGFLMSGEVWQPIRKMSRLRLSWE